METPILPLEAACPICKIEQYDGVDCTACGFNVEKYSVAGFKAAQRKATLTASKRRQSEASAPAEVPRKKRKSKKTEKFQERRMKSGVKIVKAGPRPLSEEEVQDMKNKADEIQMGFAAARISRDIMRLIDKRIQRDKWTFPVARYKFVMGVVTELKDIVV